jgi:hypothetical protein
MFAGLGQAADGKPAVVKPTGMFAGLEEKPKSFWSTALLNRPKYQAAAAALPVLAPEIVGGAKLAEKVFPSTKEFLESPLLSKEEYSRPAAGPIEAGVEKRVTGALIGQTTPTTAAIATALGPIGGAAEGIATKILGPEVVGGIMALRPVALATKFGKYIPSVIFGGGAGIGIAKIYPELKDTLRTPQNESLEDKAARYEKAAGLATQLGINAAIFGLSALHLTGGFKSSSPLWNKDGSLRTMTDSGEPLHVDPSHVETVDVPRPSKTSMTRQEFYDIKVGDKVLTVHQSMVDDTLRRNPGSEIVKNAKGIPKVHPFKITTTDVVTTPVVEIPEKSASQFPGSKVIRQSGKTYLDLSGYKEGVLPSMYVHPDIDPQTPGVALRRGALADGRPVALNAARVKVVEDTDQSLNLMDRYKRGIEVSGKQAKQFEGSTFTATDGKTYADVGDYERTHPTRVLFHPDVPAPIWNQGHRAINAQQAAEQKANIRAYEFENQPDVLRLRGSASTDMASAIWAEAGGDPSTLIKWSRDLENNRYLHKSNSLLQKEFIDLVDQASQLQQTDPEAVQMSKQLLNSYAQDFDRLVEMGKLPEGAKRENYIGSHVYDPKDPTVSGLSLKRTPAGTKPGFLKPRSFNSLIDAVNEGYRPTEGLTAMRARYIRAMGRLEGQVAAEESMLTHNAETDNRPVALDPKKTRMLMDDATGRKVSAIPLDARDVSRYDRNDVVSSKDDEGNVTYGLRVDDYRPGPDAFQRSRTVMRRDLRSGEEVPISEKTPLLIHPDYADQINKAFGQDTSWFRTNPITRAALRATKEMKEAKLSLSPFHLLAVGPRGMALGVDIGDAIRPPEVDTTSPAFTRAVEHGFVPMLDAESRAMAAEGSAAGAQDSLINKLPGAVGQINRWLGDLIFKVYLPRLKYQTYLAQERILAKNNPNWTMDEVSSAAARLANTLGGLNYKMLGRSLNGMDASRLAVLAPDFSEGMLRWMQESFRPGQVRPVWSGMAKLVAAGWGISRVLNLLTSGLAHGPANADPHLEEPFGVVSPDGKHVYSIRSLPGDIYRMATDPTKFAEARLSMAAQEAKEILTGRDINDKMVQGWRQHAVNFLGNVAPIGLSKLFPYVDEPIRKGVGQAASRLLTAASRIPVVKDYAEAAQQGLDAAGKAQEKYEATPGTALQHETMRGTGIGTGALEVLGSEVSQANTRASKLSGELVHEMMPQIGAGTEASRSEQRERELHNRLQDDLRAAMDADDRAGLQKQHPNLKAAGQKLKEAVKNGDITYKAANRLYRTVQSTNKMSDTTARVYLRLHQLPPEQRLQVYAVMTNEERRATAAYLYHSGVKWLKSQQESQTPAHLAADQTYLNTLQLVAELGRWGGNKMKLPPELADEE